MFDASPSSEAQPREFPELTRLGSQSRIDLLANRLAERQFVSVPPAVRRQKRLRLSSLLEPRATTPICEQQDNSDLHRRFQTSSSRQELLSRKARFGSLLEFGMRPDMAFWRNIFAFAKF